MTDTPDTAQWLDKIRSSYELVVRRDDYAIPRSVVGDLLDHIDTLTAKLAETERELNDADALNGELLADRDALRAVGPLDQDGAT
jgi:hypothetical protein